MKLYLDEDLSVRIAEIARALGADVRSSHECGRNGLSDEEQLRLAAADGRCLVTRNRQHYVLLTVSFLANGWAHAGVLFVPDSLPGDRFAAIAQALVLYVQSHPEGIPAYAIDFLRPAD